MLTANSSIVVLSNSKVQVYVDTAVPLYSLVNNSTTLALEAGV